MNVFGLVVGGNEADRFLVSFLENVVQTVDALLYYDDQSTDGSLDIVQSFPAQDKIKTYRRHDSIPSFLQHEGRFRQDSWHALEHYLQPSIGDFILSIDTDEVLVGETECTSCEVRSVIEKTESGVVLLNRPEVWGYDDKGWPLVRTDGYWGQIRCTRLFAYKPDGKIRDVRMACGSEPEWVGRVRNPTFGSPPLQLLHYGYSVEADRLDKYQRYVQHPGHNPNHIASIVATPQLKPWNGVLPPRMERGGFASAPEV